MKLKTLHKGLILGALLSVSTQSIQSASSDLKIVSDNTLVTVTNYLEILDTAGSTRSNMVFAPASTSAIVQYAATNATTLTSPTFRDGVQLSTYSTHTLTLNSASFTQSASRPYLTCDYSGGTVAFPNAPTFTGSGWIEINENTTFDFSTMTAALTLSAPIRIALGKTLTITNGSTYALTFSGVVSGLGTLSYSDTENLVFAASPTFATYSVGGVSTLLLNNGITFSPNITLGIDASIIEVASGGTATVSGIISGAHTVKKGTNTSTLILSGANTFSSSMTILGGTVKAGNNAAYGTATLVVTSGTIDVTASGFSIANAITPTACTFNVPTGYMVTYSGQIGSGGAGVAHKTGAGTMVLSNAANAPLSWDLSGGAVNLNGGRFAAASKVVTVNTAMTIGFLSGVTEPTDIALNAALTLTSDIGITGQLTGTISGGYGLTKTGKGIVSLGHANTFTGGVTVNAGQITMGAASALGTGNLTLAPGALVLTDATAHTLTAVGAPTIRVY